MIEDNLYIRDLMKKIENTTHDIFYITSTLIITLSDTILEYYRVSDYPNLSIIESDIIKKKNKVKSNFQLNPKLSEEEYQMIIKRFKEKKLCYYDQDICVSIKDIYTLRLFKIINLLIRLNDTSCEFSCFLMEIHNREK
nr:MAG: hypothetical protein [Metapenaeopsis lamellata majanivirus]